MALESIDIIDRAAEDDSWQYVDFYLKRYTCIKSSATYLLCREKKSICMVPLMRSYYINYKRPDSVENSSQSPIYDANIYVDNLDYTAA